MISLIKFRDYLGKGDGKTKAPPATIKAADLDGNFSAVTLVPDKLGVTQPEYSKHGTSILFMAAKRPAYWQEIDVCVDGVGKKMMVLGTAPYSAP